MFIEKVRRFSTRMSAALVQVWQIAPIELWCPLPGAMMVHVVLAEAVALRQGSAPSLRLGPLGYDDLIHILLARLR